MAYNSVIGSSDVGGIIPTATSYEMIQNLQAEKSHCMRLGRRLRDMTVRESDLPVLSALASAYFLDGDTDLVETTEINWTDVTVYAKDLAALVPVPKNVLNDAQIPIWDSVRPELEEALGVAIDNAMLWGTNKPSSWPTAIYSAASSASNEVSIASFSDLYDAILGDDGLYSVVEQDGFMVTGGIAHLEMKGRLRGVRSSTGEPILTSDPASPMRYVLDGAPIDFPRTGIASSTYKMVAGDWSQLVYSVRQDMEFEIFTQGVIQDSGGNIVYNLMQQRMAAIMVVMRLGFALPNPINRIQTTEASRYPFATLTA